MWLYLQNCFILLIPILIWNLIFFHKLPKAFLEAEPTTIKSTIFNIVEHLFRIIVFIMTLFLKLNITSPQQKVGLLIYLAGVLLYFISWIPLINKKETIWKNSYFGLLGPSFTPIIWLLGIALIGNKSFIAIDNVSFIFISLSILFITFHVIHTFYLIKNNLKESN